MRNSYNGASRVESFVKYIISMSQQYEDKDVKEVILSLIPDDKSRMENYEHNGYMNETWQIQAEERIRTMRLLKERGVIR